MSGCVFNIHLICAEYNVWERSKDHPTNIMNKILENILNEKSARSEEETETLAVAQNEFLSWG
jgi:hypothetical protein